MQSIDDANWSEAALQPGAKRTLILDELIDFPHDLSHVTENVGYLVAASASRAVFPDHRTNVNT